MYLTILALPLLGAASAGFLGRKIGVSGAHLITCTFLVSSAVLSIIAFYEVGLSGSPVTIYLSSWIDSESMLVNWGFLFDSLTVSMLLPVLVVSSLVHIFSVDYMSADPHNQRFFSYLSMFTFFMLILVAGDNYLVMFVGWEGIGISSYLLINFWFTRIQANKSAIKALTVNRVGDMFLSVGFFALFWVFGNLDYSTVFSLSPFMNESALTLIGLLLLLAAMGKSAQIGLHTWLPDAMEGYWNYASALMLSCFVLLLAGIVITFGTMNMNLFSLNMTSIPVILSSLPRATLETMTGNMLGDGSLRYPNLGRDKVAKGNARYNMAMSNKAYDYMLSLFTQTYSAFSTTNMKLNPYPNTSLPQHAGKSVTQYTFHTRCLPVFTELHSLWYKWEVDHFTKVLPLCIGEMFGPIALAHWIMEDGYFDNYGRSKTIVLCTECFTKDECLLLINVLAKLGISATLKIRGRGINNDPTYRIRISKSGMPLLRQLVLPHMHPIFMYKLGDITS